MKKLLVLLVVLLIIYTLVGSGTKNALKLPNSSDTKTPAPEKVKVITEESVVIDVVKNVAPSVVTVGAQQSQAQNPGNINMGPFSVFFQEPNQAPNNNPEDNYIGSGFVIKNDGLIVTNKHVVSDRTLTYFIVDYKGNKYKVDKIYRDPSNDIAILKISNPPLGTLKEAQLGDSSKLQVGQMAIAIGTALGEFRNTVTTGVISGLGRGITAGSPFEGFAERLDNVIQTNAAINPGNSGGPLLASSGQVIGINTAVSQSGQNIGFAIPINIVKDSLTNFNQTGQFNRPYLGVTYTIINQRTALLNNVPQGAYIQDITNGSPAEQAGIQKDDIIVKVDGKNISGSDGSLADIISNKKVGDTITVTVYRDADMKDFRVKLAQAPGD
ncbi:MAG: hypothetical protein A2857_01395 [Candidatus Levybacteria bacterium RIFCSPHIGHO2_01_FULL_36_15]|nr:MAG: hypothetical protein A2857_01395 [Candidatus Levybacteria bacterium RIFCSPHIGHO2_01_FULL_36_15]OGH38047.1 MAG: hypothetical protein A2905_05085 [Candidatus Levybacteria bacterium RIFCSPLOWO2_01_FULL_36_10]